MLVASYRLQLSEAFGLADAAATIPYLQALGVSHLYLSPVLTARAGSRHGYDRTDPTRVSPALGGARQFSALVRAARRAGMRIILDIVPNHMAAHEENPWWRDVLQCGYASPCARHFDLHWSMEAPPRIPLPLLATSLAEALDTGALQPIADDAGLALRYHDRRLPLNPASYRVLLTLLSSQDEAILDAEGAAADTRRLLRGLAILRRGWTGAHTLDLRAVRRALRLWRQLHRRSAGFRGYVARCLARIAHLGADERHRFWKTLLAAQHYTLLHWRTATQQAGYRRFFDINDLVAVNAEDPVTFEALHALPLRWVRAGLIHGLRVDHIDGLADPEAYLIRLRREAGPTAYIVVEKILAPDEDLPPWPIDGTTGYDFLAELDGLFVLPHGLAVLTDHYRRVTGETRAFVELLHAIKLSVQDALFAGERTDLARDLCTVSGTSDGAATVMAVNEITAHMGTYRTYITASGTPPDSATRIATATAGAAEAARAGRTARSDLDAPRLLRALAIARTTLLGTAPDPATERVRQHFVRRWQQYAGPVMAKALEDTALYRYVPLASANEVGGDPARPQRTVAEWHGAMERRARSLPRTMNATSTHDTKRSEDARSRLAVLCEVPQRWASAFARCHDLLADTRAHLPAGPTPAVEDEILAYQTLLAIWPANADLPADAHRRLHAYAIKAAREAGCRTSWIEPDPAYETGLARFLDALLRSPEALAIWQDLVNHIAPYGALNSLAMVLLKSCAPGTPDFYQGTEDWSLRLVDPDNRAPIDFAPLAARIERLRPIIDAPEAETVRNLLQRWPDGDIKLFLTAAVLKARRRNDELFQDGAYQRLEVEGQRSLRIIAFARQSGRQRVVILATRWLASLGEGAPPPPSTWEGSRVSIPGPPSRWRNALTGEITARPASSLRLDEIFRTLPLCLLEPFPDTR